MTQQEQVQTTISLMIPATGLAGVAGGNQIVYLENYVDQLLPDPCYITNVKFWAESQYQYKPSKVNGNITVGIDPGKQYIKASGFPALQRTTPRFMKTLAEWELYSLSNKSNLDFNPPISYHPGIDAILVCPECTVTITNPPDPDTPGMSNILWIFLCVSFIANGDLNTLPMPIETYKDDNDHTNSDIEATSIRNLFPAQTGSQIRFHFSSGSCDPVPTPYRSQASHVSVGIQSGTGPNTVNTPVEVTTNGVSGYNLTPGGDGWTDWIDFSATVGQNILAIVSFMNAANTWGYKNGACGNWNSPTNGWNQAVMPGPIVPFLANRTHAIDRVQQR